MRKNGFAECVVILVFILLFSGCTIKNESGTLKKDELGYDLALFLDMSENETISALRDHDIEVKRIAEEQTINVNACVYTYHEVIFDQTYTVTLTFASRGDYGKDSERLLTEYTKELAMVEWPDHEQAEAIQEVYEAMKEKYGEGSEKFVLNEENICMNQKTQYISWGKGNFAWRSFRLAYKPETYTTLPSEYDAMVIIKDQSEEYQKVLMR